ncbi:MAG: type II toxin-antitoxin system VapB family antitoxin [Gammaproteobacteria bacterium]|nr:type II toxin-antitoxin system VapB family antitoxin [Gammaproteobacteria bacterium]
MEAEIDYKGVAKVFWSGRSQAVRLPAACRFEATEVEIVKRGEQLTLKPRGKDWGAFFRSKSRASLPAREQLALEEREKLP